MILLKLIFSVVWKAMPLADRLQGFCEGNLIVCPNSRTTNFAVKSFLIQKITLISGAV